MKKKFYENDLHVDQHISWTSQHVKNYLFWCYVQWNLKLFQYFLKQFVPELNHLSAFNEKMFDRFFSMFTKYAQEIWFFVEL